MTPYSPAWYANFRSSSLQSAERIVPRLLELVPAGSVVDVGCGLGVWLDTFRRQGVEQIFGIDGDYVDPEQLLIGSENFSAYDLHHPFPARDRYDLAMSLEVAEHLPAECADQFVRQLTQLSDVVFFSAAIPSQGGTHHVNERWPHYWADKFRECGYEHIDAIRPQVWDDDQVDFWYAQNSMIYANERALDRYPRLRSARHESSGRIPLAMVHPRLFARTAQQLEQTIDQRMRRWLRRSLGWVRSASLR